ncbi:HEAT repeat domain-containing protein, partial [Moorena sp. SIO3B2]|uniref:HEAT repeat domain-containing protein n=1 Tax=Moorena sp. SIO3B2 TaxID=2607827 RepID=UPI0013CAF4A2
RIRGIRLLAEAGLPAGDITFEEIEPSLDQVIRDHPDHLELVHEYDQMPTLEFLINELYHTDFGRCYLGSKTLLKLSPDAVADALLATYADKAHNDYGAHYHVVKLLGWLKYTDAYDLIVEALHNKAPQFQKSRAAAAIALGNLGDERAIPLLKDSLNTKIFNLKYASLMALEQFGDTSGQDLAANDSDWLIRSKAFTKAVTSH